MNIDNINTDVPSCTLDDDTKVQKIIWNPNSCKLICFQNANVNNVIYTHLGGSYELCIDARTEDITDPLGVLFLWNEIAIWEKDQVLKKYADSSHIPAIVFLEMAIKITQNYQEDIYYSELGLHNRARNFLNRNNIIISWQEILHTVPTKIRH